MNYETLCKLCKPFKGKVSEAESGNLEKALDFLEVDASPEDTKGVARIIAIVGFFIAYEIIVGLSFLLEFSPLWFIFGGIPLISYVYLKRYPMLKAESEKKQALGELPEVMSYLIMSLRINPNLENAVEFSYNHSSGILEKKLKRIMSKVRTGQENAEEGLVNLSEEFGKWDEFKRSIRLVIASTLERSEERRQETLDKASDVLLGGLTARTEKEARALNTPVMVVFTFGVILPLIFVAIIPFMSLMGIQMGAVAVGVLYTIALPIFLFIMIKFIASNRPITMRAPKVPNEKKKGLLVLISLGVGVLFTLPILAGKEALGSMEYIPVLWGFGAASGSLFLMSSLNVRKIRKSVKEMENSFSETLHQLGVILSEGKPLEDAIRSCDSEFLKRAAMNIQGLNTDLRSAFFDKEFGSLKEVYSDTVRGILDIIVSISDKGSNTMAKVSFRMSDHMNNLKKSEAEIERALGGVVSSMKIIAMVVAPLVGGMISSMSVVLGNTLAESEGAAVGFSESSATIDPSLITLIIGIYAMESAAILVMFGAELIHGNDKIMKRYSMGLALPIAIFVFTICGFIANSLFASIA